jgi:hypothetical protein
MSKMTFGYTHLVKGIDPVADAMDTTQYTDVVKMAGHSVCRFIVYKGVGATGTATVTIEACDNANGDNPVAVPFSYQAYAGADDVPAAVVKAAAAGFALTAGSSQLYDCQVDSQVLSGKAWVRMKFAEVVNSPVLAGVMIELINARYATEIPDTAIA